IENVTNYVKKSWLVSHLKHIYHLHKLLQCLSKSPSHSIFQLKTLSSTVQQPNLVTNGKTKHMIQICQQKME
ncbi:hypothetical protein L9F63_005253, partial [Diploptera punctata]